MKLVDARKALDGAVAKVAEAEQARAEARDGVNAALAEVGWFDDGTIMAPGAPRRYRNPAFSRSLTADEVERHIEFQKRALAS